MLFVFSFGVSFSQKGTVSSLDFKKLSWLEGTWSQTNEKKPGRTSTEQWQVSGDYILSGRTVTLQGKDTLSIEKATLLIQDNTLYYVADVPHNKQPVYFKLTSLNDNGFVCENSSHDFPKKISYQLFGNILKATISGDGKAIDYIFKRN